MRFIKLSRLALAVLLASGLLALSPSIHHVTHTHAADATPTVAPLGPGKPGEPAD